MFQIIPSDKISLVSVFVSKLVPIDRKILWEINSACKLEMEIRRTLEEQCPLGAILRVPTSTNFANTQVYQNAGNLFRDFDSKIRYRNWKKKKIKSSSVLFFFDLYEGKEENMATVSVNILEVFYRDDWRSGLNIANCQSNFRFFPFFSFYKIEKIDYLMFIYFISLKIVFWNI